jgi:non-specific serine/threonine protein kinase
LATSREALRVPGEVAWRVPSLDVPPSASAVRVEDLLPHAAVRLFMDRAQAANPALRLCDENAAAVAQICRRLDGIPLALELAAARARALSPEQIAARLDRRFQLLTGGSRAALQRQQTLHAAVAWSYDLLTPPERELFHRLAVFAGEFDLDTVESVCADDLIEPSQILDLLAELLDKSLVSARPQGNIVRYRMLETLRAFAAEKLAAAGDEPRLRRRHLDHCLAATHDIATRLMTGGQQVAVLAAVDTEVDNLRAALAWALEHAPQDALRLAVALGNYWYHRGHWGEARDVMRRALDRGAAAPPQLRARGLWFLAVYAYRQSDYGEADLLSRQSLELHEQTGDFPGMTDPLNLRGLIAWERTDLSAARATHQQCLALCESLGNRRLILRSYGNLALVLADQGEYAAAVAMTSQSLQLAREIGNRWMEGLGIINLGRYALLQGDIDGSRTLLEQGLAVGRELRDRYTLAWGLNPLGEIARRRGLFDQARACFREALTACAQVGEKREQGRGLRGMARLAMDQGAWDEAERLFAESVRLLAGIGCRGDVAESFEALAQLAAIRLAAPGGVPNNAPPAASDSVQSAASTAAFRLGAAQAVRNALALPLPPLFHAEVAQTRAALTQRLGAADFEAIFSRGTALTLEQALAEAAPPQPSHA